MMRKIGAALCISMSLFAGKIFAECGGLSPDLLKEIAERGQRLDPNGRFSSFLEPAKKVADKRIQKEQDLVKKRHEFSELRDLMREPAKFDDLYSEFRALLADTSAQNEDLVNKVADIVESRNLKIEELFSITYQEKGATKVLVEELLVKSALAEEKAFWESKRQNDASKRIDQAAQDPQIPPSLINKEYIIVLLSRAKHFGQTILLEDQNPDGTPKTSTPRTLLSLIQQAVKDENGIITARAVASGAKQNLK